MLSFYQHLPSYINPVAFSVGSFEVRWYAVMYLVAFGIAYLLLQYRIKKQEAKYNPEFVLDFLLYAMPGLLIGARLGYVLFYSLPYYLVHPLEAFLPIKITSYGLLVTGYYGMSYYGGVIGIVLAGIIFCKKYKTNFWKLADFVVPAIPAGYFFGRLGNFLNGELVGRVTTKSWGMYFADGSLRHPSQLYEAFFEGLVIFVILWLIRNNAKFSGKLLPFYLFLYACARFGIEFFREPDPQIGLILGFLTLGQIFSLTMMLFTVVVSVSGKKKLCTSVR